MFTPAVGASYLYILAGFAGMIVFATKFGSSLRQSNLSRDERVYRMGLVLVTNYRGYNYSISKLRDCNRLTWTTGGMGRPWP